MKTLLKSAMPAAFAGVFMSEILIHYSFLIDLFGIYDDIGHALITGCMVFIIAALTYVWLDIYGKIKD